MNINGNRFLPENATRQKVLIGACAVIVLLAAVLVGRQMLTPPPPNPVLAEASEIAQYMADTRFMQLPSEQRETFVRQVADRYMQMNREERQDFEAQWKQVRGGAEMRQHIEAQMSIALLRYVSEPYFELTTPREQAAYLDRILVMVQITDNPLSQELRKWMDEDHMQARVNRMNQSPSQMNSLMQRYRRDVLSATNAVERARLNQFSNDLLKHAREYRNN